MSITLEQANCIHDFDDNFYCKKCGYIDLNMQEFSELSLSVVGEEDLVPKSNEEHNLDSKVGSDDNEIDISEVKFTLESAKMATQGINKNDF